VNKPTIAHQGHIRGHASELKEYIFVFGSNERGYHGAGAANYANRHRGARWGVGFGLTGTSFAIPTKDKQIRTLPLAEVRFWVEKFLHYAKEHPELTFQVTAIGCGLAGYQHMDIAPMFEDAPDNCLFDRLWQPWLQERHRYWGTF
jgi:hypothetical protein